MTGDNRLQKKGIGSGRKRKRHKYNGYDKKDLNQLGGIPMKVRNGKIVYAKKVPHGYWKDKITGEWTDGREQEMNRAISQHGAGSFVRRHLYELRFDMPPEDETDDERRKREYREWWEHGKT